MLKNADITVINRWTDKDGDHYTAAWIKDVWWYGGILKSVGEKGLDGAASYKISIYEASEKEKPYLPYYDWATVDNKSSFWTLTPGDYLVKGIVAAGGVLRPADFLSKQECAQVIGFKDLRLGPLPYIRVEGK